VEAGDEASARVTAEELHAVLDRLKLTALLKALDHVASTQPAVIGVTLSRGCFAEGSYTWSVQTKP